MNTDLDLIKHIKAGDLSAFDTIISKYKDYVYTICFRMLRNKPEAEEAAQDTFLKMYKSLPRLELTAKLSTWIYKIAYRTSLDYIRKRKRTVDLDEAVNKISNEESAAKRLEVQDEKIMLDKAIDKLSTEEAGLIKLFYFEEMHIDELSEITGLGKSNVKIKMFRARKKLKLIIEEQFASVKQNTIHG